VPPGERKGEGKKTSWLSGMCLRSRTRNLVVLLLKI
jgi:hypothetical protein